MRKLEIMKTQMKKTWTLILGIMLVIVMIATSFSHSFIISSGESSQTDLLTKYKSIPLVTAPLQVLAKGLSSINNK